MGIFSFKNSFFQFAYKSEIVCSGFPIVCEEILNPQNDIKSNCVEPVIKCLPVYENEDLYGLNLYTDDAPTVPPEDEDDPTYPLVSYCFRTVSNCSEPVINSDIVKHYNQFYYYDLNNGTWLISAVKYSLKPDDFIYPTNDFDVSPAVDFGVDSYGCEACFYIQVIKTVRSENPDQETELDAFIYTNTIIGCIGCFKKICDPCYTTKIFYFNNENAFGFKYQDIQYPPIILPRLVFQAIRLPFYFLEPQFITKRNVFTLSNGRQKKLSSRIEKEWLAETDYMPKEWHERLAIALEHDTVVVINSNSNLDSEIMADANYEIDWQRFLNHPTAKATFKAKQIPYNNSNSNCL